ncbi:GNAT family N-acetyltransferase [Parasphingopyxis marina]|uniref:GNAT family N-acetyltransferase n=1 Tax=Parasphingopyxis marina TaxID=2761622 RepID=UPI002E27B4EF|nr:GNAT family protein [Parasphingopyxis marina]
MTRLATALHDGPVSLVPFDDRYREGLRAACAADTEIWEIYPFSMAGEHFDTALERVLAFHRTDSWVPMIALGREDEVVGMSSYIGPDGTHGVVEIGGTYIVPALRGTGYNYTMKRLMIDHAVTCGFTRIEFRVDTRNKRSMAAVLKLGATHEGTLRKNRITWTGYVRDTAVFGLLADEWTKHL